MDCKQAFEPMKLSVMMMIIIFGLWMLAAPEQALKMCSAIEFPEGHDSKLEMVLMRYMGAASVMIGFMFGTCDFTKSGLVAMGLLPLPFMLMDVYYSIKDPVIDKKIAFLDCAIGAAMSATCLGTFTAQLSEENKKLEGKEPMSSDKIKTK
mmetsp:Transcript_4455/g.9585  ORF Transcript_4455/g.9585 Transcript_4455/m.9585 type:complete len:151 (-) Transcript_4455:220-672(-)